MSLSNPLDQSRVYYLPYLPIQNTYISPTIAYENTGISTVSPIGISEADLRSMIGQRYARHFLVITSSLVSGQNSSRTFGSIYTVCYVYR